MSKHYHFDKIRDYASTGFVCCVHYQSTPPRTSVMHDGDVWEIIIDYQNGLILVILCNGENDYMSFYKMNNRIVIDRKREHTSRPLDHSKIYDMDDMHDMIFGAFDSYGDLDERLVHGLL